MDRRAFDPFSDRLDLDQYGLGAWDADDLVIPTSRLYTRYRAPRVLRPTSWVDRESGLADKHLSKDKFSLTLDCHHFHPDEVSVKTKDNNLIVEAKHEERQDSHGFITRSFTRRYPLPDDIKIENLSCNISSDGILSVEAPRKSAQPGGETSIPIRQTGRPATVVPPKEEKKEEKGAGSGNSAPTGNSGSTGTGRSQNIPIEREATAS